MNVSSAARILPRVPRRHRAPRLATLAHGLRHDPRRGYTMHDDDNNDSTSGATTTGNGHQGLDMKKKSLYKAKGRRGGGKGGGGGGAGRRARVRCRQHQSEQERQEEHDLAQSQQPQKPQEEEKEPPEPEHQRQRAHQEQLRRHISQKSHGELASCHRNLALEMVRVTESAVSFPPPLQPPPPLSVYTQLFLRRLRRGRQKWMHERMSERLNE